MATDSFQVHFRAAAECMAVHRSIPSAEYLVSLTLDTDQADIVISYAREDERRVQLLCQALEAQGWSVFWDRRTNVTRDAISSFQKACDGGDMTGCTNLALAYEHGTGVARDATNPRCRQGQLPLPEGLRRR
ncbi:MAG TPA: hypothetical protein VF516_46365 [Kofleriaceae bacterium]